MRFLFIANILRNENSGAAGNIMQLSRALNKTGHIAHCFFRDDLAASIKKNIFLNTIMFLLFPIIAVFKIFYLGFKNHYDFVDIASGDGFLYALFAKIVSRKKKPIIIMHSHGYEYLYKKEFETEKHLHRQRRFSNREKIFMYGFRLIQVKFFSFLSDSIFSFSEKEKMYLEKLYPKKKIFSIPMGIDPIFTSQKETIRNRDILFVGGWIRLRGWIYLVDIINRLDKKIDDLTVSIIGTGIDEDNVLVNFPETIRHKIRIIKHLPKDKLKQEYDSHKVFLFPSLIEGYGTVIAEAMASGMVVVISEDLGASEIITNGYNGFLIKKRDIDGFTKTVEGLLKDEVLMRKIGKNAQGTVSHMTWDNMAEIFIKKCEEI